MAIIDAHPNPPPPPHAEVFPVKCASCGFTEDCTAPFIARVRERHQGRWICGLCVEAVQHEALRSQMLISTEEALDRHIKICNNFRVSTSSSSNDKTEHPILAMGRVFRRSLDSPRRAIRSNSISSLRDVERVATAKLVRSGSCFPALNS